ncbi:MAG: hypothetical protein ACLPYS_04440 [Vulcanimicrobiaceae bacterium]
MLCRSPARAETDLGLTGAILTGTHVGEENPTPVSGIAPGALLEATQKWGRLHVHLEGFPSVSVRASSAGNLGTSSATLGLLNSTVLYDLDHNRRFRAGLGFQIIDLRSFNGNNGDIDEARVTSPIYTVASDLPVGRNRFVELNLMVDPNIKGLLHVLPADGSLAYDEPEAGAEVDYSAALGWQRGATTYLLGARFLNYHTRNVDTGALVDRNVGGGVTLEVRVALGRK